MASCGTRIKPLRNKLHFSPTNKTETISERFRHKRFLISRMRINSFKIRARQWIKKERDGKHTADYLAKLCRNLRVYDTLKFRTQVSDSGFVRKKGVIS